MNSKIEIAKRILQQEIMRKEAFVPMSPNGDIMSGPPQGGGGGQPPPPQGDPMAGGGGGQPPGDPSMGGQPPMDPNAMGGSSDPSQPVTVGLQDLVQLFAMVSQGGGMPAPGGAPAPGAAPMSDPAAAAQAGAAPGGAPAPAGGAAAPKGKGKNDTAGLEAKVDNLTNEIRQIANLLHQTLGALMGPQIPSQGGAPGGDPTGGQPPGGGGGGEILNETIGQGMQGGVPPVQENPQLMQQQAEYHEKEANTSAASRLHGIIRNLTNGR